MDRDDFKTYRGVFDSQTLKLLEDLIKRGYLDSLDQVLRPGKEAEVFIGKKDKELRAIKIYRINNSNFKKISQYIKRDTRFKFGSSKFGRRTIYRWVEKEFRNLLKAHKNFINVPFAYKSEKNVIIMEFIDSEMLKDTFLENPEDMLGKIVEQINLMNKSNMIHADLSEFNIMIKDNQPILIDFGQAIYYNNENEFLCYKDLYDRDVDNIFKYFKRKYKIKKTREDYNI